MKFLSLYKKYKDIFVKPKLKIYFGFWKNDPNLPVWRRRTIALCKWDEYDSFPYILQNFESEYVWNRKGRQNHPLLSKYFKPIYKLPYCLSFYYSNNDLLYKTKYIETEFIYEWPPQITIVFFGISLTITAGFGDFEGADYMKNQYYWESMLLYDYYNGDLKKVNDTIGRGPISHNYLFKTCFLKDPEKIKLILRNI